MSKFGKFLAGATIFTAAAVGVYEVMKKSAAKEETEDGAEGESTDFASRAYTTIRRGTEQVADKVTQEVMPRVKEAIGPRTEGQRGSGHHRGDSREGEGHRGGIGFKGGGYRPGRFA